MQQLAFAGRADSGNPLNATEIERIARSISYVVISISSDQIHIDRYRLLRSHIWFKSRETFQPCVPFA
jgi:hypothetical protein